MASERFRLGIIALWLSLGMALLTCVAGIIIALQPGLKYMPPAERYAINQLCLNSITHLTDENRLATIWDCASSIAAHDMRMEIVFKGLLVALVGFGAALILAILLAGLTSRETLRRSYPLDTYLQIQ